MLNVCELRIGNIIASVSNPDCMLEVKSISISALSNITLINNTIPFDDIVGISITKDFIYSNFKRIENEFYGDEYFGLSIKHKPIGFNGKYEPYFQFLFRDNVNYAWVYLTDILYIHELQNIYLSIFKQELKLT